MMTYLFPMYLIPGFHVHLDDRHDHFSVTICFVVNAGTGEVLAYASSFGYPTIDLYQRALMLLRGRALDYSKLPPLDGLFSRIMLQHTKYKGLSRQFDHDELMPSLDLKNNMKLRRQNRPKFQSNLVHHFYDWHHEELELIDDPYIISREALMKILQRAVSRTNSEIVN